MKIGFIGMWKYGFCNDRVESENGVFEKNEIIVSNLTEEEAEEVRKTWSCDNSG